jgi:hypothetical protein
VRPPYLAHPTAAQQFDQLVAAERRPLHRFKINQRGPRVSAD